MALHGGLEAGTERIATRVADRTGASLYTVTQPADLGWHIPSTGCTPGVSDALDRFLSHVRTVVSFHGFGRPHLRRTVLVGGRNRVLGARLAGAIRSHTGLRVVSNPAAIPVGLRGRHPANPVNLPRLAGAQLELSASARMVPEVDALVEAVTMVIDAHRRRISAPA